MSVIGILHPGAMGSTIGQVLFDKGHEVIWASEDRSDKTKKNAASFTDVGTIEAVAKKADVIFSICQQTGVVPNFAAVESSGFKGIYVDANFIDEESWEMNKRDTFDECAKSANFYYVDGAIYGYPIPGPANCTDERTFYLSGEKALDVAQLFHDTPFEGLECDDAKSERKNRMASEYEGFHSWFHRQEMEVTTPMNYEDTKVFKGDSNETS